MIVQTLVLTDEQDKHISKLAALAGYEDGNAFLQAMINELADNPEVHNSLGEALAKELQE